MQFDGLTIAMFVVLAGLLVFMFYSSRKRRRQAEELQKKVVEGAYVMTNFGLYGTIVTIDEEKNVIVLETAPGHEVKVHRQVVTRVVDEDAASDDEETRDADEHTLEGEPEYGERIESATESSDATDEDASPKSDTSSKPKSTGPAAD